MKINILPKSVYTLIAAGEVVENPRAIVKELVENSIDAGAANISIYVEDGGLKSINIVDDGLGIPKNELINAILPHATSKIKESIDLSTIGTLGFRGEALSSICAVSEVTIKSKYFEEEMANMIVVKGSEVILEQATAHNLGTSILVTNLFYNTPVRFNFLRKKKGEEKDVTNTVNALILSNPTISIKYFVDNKLVIASNGNGLWDAVNSVYPKEIIDNLLEVKYNVNHIHIEGYISNLGYVKNTRSFLTYIINGRIVENKGLNSCVLGPYTNKITKGTFPICILDFTMPFDQVDVNIHPNKREVKIAEYSDLNGIIYKCISSVLDDYLDKKSNGLFQFENVIDNIDKFDKGTNIFEPNDTTTNKVDKSVKNDASVELNNPNKTTFTQDANTYALKSENKVSINDVKQPLDFSMQERLPIDEEKQKEINNYFNLVVANSKNLDFTPNLNDNLGGYFPFIQNEQISESSVVKTFNQNTKTPENKVNNKTTLDVYNEKCYKRDKMPSSAYSIIDQNEIDEFLHPNKGEETVESIKVIGQVFNTYIIVEMFNELYFIDQHAAHESILFNKFSLELDNYEVAAQNVIPPYIFSTDLVNRFSENLKMLTSFGFDITIVDESNISINSIPSLMRRVDLLELIKGIEELIQTSPKVSLKDILHDDMATKACKTAIKGNSNLTNSQIKGVIRDYVINEAPLKCPHGRPTVIKLTQSEIEKLFKRKK